MTKRFGALEFSETEIISFQEGILGFEEYHNYVVIDQKETSFKFLQCVDEPELTFIVIMPELVRADYTVELREEQAQNLEIEAPVDAQVYAIVTIPENLAEMTANLQANAPLRFFRRF